jgi:carbon storage regulator CsrA
LLSWIEEIKRMLNLNRKSNQSIFIRDNDTGKELELIVLSIEGKTVKLGFEGDSQKFTILRKEVKQREENHENPNPFYKDRIPTVRRRHEGIPLLSMDELNNYFKQAQEENKAA